MKVAESDFALVVILGTNNQISAAFPIITIAFRAVAGAETEVMELGM